MSPLTSPRITSYKSILLIRIRDPVENVLFCFVVIFIIIHIFFWFKIVFYRKMKWKMLNRAWRWNKVKQLMGLRFIFEIEILRKDKHGLIWIKWYSKCVPLICFSPVKFHRMEFIREVIRQIQLLHLFREKKHEENTIMTVLFLIWKHSVFNACLKNSITFIIYDVIYMS